MMRVRGPEARSFISLSNLKKMVINNPQLKKIGKRKKNDHMQLNSRPKNGGNRNSLRPLAIDLLASLCMLSGRKLPIILGKHYAHLLMFTFASVNIYQDPILCKNLSMCVICRASD